MPWLPLIPFACSLVSLLSPRNHVLIATAIRGCGTSGDPCRAQLRDRTVLDHRKRVCTQPRVPLQIRGAVQNTCWRCVLIAASFITADCDSDNDSDWSAWHKTCVTTCAVDLQWMTGLHNPSIAWEISLGRGPHGEGGRAAPAVAVVAVAPWPALPIFSAQRRRWGWDAE